MGSRKHTNARENVFLVKNPREKSQKNVYKENSHPQLLTEGAETWQAAGRAIALVTLRTTPN